MLLDERVNKKAVTCLLSIAASGAARIWRWGTQGVWWGGIRGLGNRGPPAQSRGRALVGGSRGRGIASRKLIAGIKDIWLPNHAQFCVFSSTAQPEIFL